MKILILLKPIQDPRIPLGFDDVVGKLKPSWNLPILNPADASALETAMSLKDEAPGTQITVVHLGPPDNEKLMREILALGCEQGIRIWDEALEEVSVQGKALVLARAAQILTFDLILAGARSEDTGNSQLGILLAFHLGVPCISRATQLSLRDNENLNVVRRLARGFSERMQSSLPSVVTIEAQEELTYYASLPQLLEAEQKAISTFDLADLGITRASIRSISEIVNVGPLHHPASKQRFVPAPDSSLPAFDRIQALLKGTMAKRAGKISGGEIDSVVEEIYQTLLQEGWLNHITRTQ